MEEGGRNEQKDSGRGGREEGRRSRRTLGVEEGEGGMSRRTLGVEEGEGGMSRRTLGEEGGRRDGGAEGLWEWRREREE